MIINGRRKDGKAATEEYEKARSDREATQGARPPAWPGWLSAPWPDRQGRSGPPVAMAAVVMRDPEATRR
jgi:hypothetical protein